MDSAKKAALAAIDEKNELIAEVADSIWDYAELSMQEVKSAALFVKVLKEEGFQVEEGICGIPTAFSASYGSGKPVIGKLFAFFLEKGERAGQKLQKKAGRGLYWALLLFVGIPLPGTGAWTGTLAASLLDMDFKKSVLACVGGVLLAGIIMGVLSQLGVEAFRAAA